MKRPPTSYLSNEKAAGLVFPSNTDTLGYSSHNLANPNHRVTKIPIHNNLHIISIHFLKMWLLFCDGKIGANMLLLLRICFTHR